MIPCLNKQHVLPELAQQFLTELNQTSGFSGEISDKIGHRLVTATDNSVYQVIPDAVVFPKTQDDISIIVKLAHSDTYNTLKITPRGGGTGTNGQSLNHGIVIDCSKYLNHILEVNLEENWVKVEPGVVLDQLNDYLKLFGKFFAPTLSPSSRATLGGMVNTDASGKGSRLYGKTSEHILELKSVFLDGTTHVSQQINFQQLEKAKQLPGIVGALYRQIHQTVTEHESLIDTTIPKLKRFITGYNLTRVYSKTDNYFNLNYLLAGSEGTLAFISEVKLKLTDIPKRKALFVVAYENFDSALQHAKDLVKLKPEAIETMDETVLELARTDIIYDKIKPHLPKASKIEAINLIEFVANDKLELKKQITACQNRLKHYQAILVENPTTIENFWELRKKSVGLLGKVKGLKKPLSGVEDTVVPPENLAEFVKEFRAILDARGLKYGMFGHIDVGCLHVRPAFNLLDEKEENAYYEIIDEVATLTHTYGGVLWGEHGKGFRSEYAKDVFGDVLYEELAKIKKVCDPHNQLNPGKIVVAHGSKQKLVPIKNELTRAQFDKTINEQHRHEFATPLSCNGNGSCFDYSTNHVMCPSYKVTRDRVHSPKGRATLLREWLRQLSLAESPKKNSVFSKIKNSLNKRQGEYDFSNEVFEAMDGCLSCQACKSQCPVNINVPDFKAKFLNKYYSRYLHPVTDYLIAYSERLGYFQSQVPKLNNFFLKSSIVQRLLKKLFGFIDPPIFSEPSLKTLLKQHKIEFLDIHHPPTAKNSVILVQDWVTSFYEAELVLKQALFYQALGHRVYVLPWFENGKTFHVKGFLNQFEKLVEKNIKFFNKISKTNIPMIGIDPTMVLTYRFEYPDFAKDKINYEIFLPQEWLINSGSIFTKLPNENKEYILLSHCTEQANCSQAQSQWREVFNKFGLKLRVKNIGCCGMAGSYGHEQNHIENSKALFNLSWKRAFDDLKPHQEIIADGFSCRAQTKRLLNILPQHPIEVLLKHLNLS